MMMKDTTLHFRRLARGWAGWLPVAALLAASCSSADDEPTPYPTPATRGVPLRFEVALGNGPAATRAIKSEALEGKGYDRLKAYWDAHDQVTMVLDHGGDLSTSKATLTEINADSTRAFFSTTLDASASAGDPITAYAPTLAADGSLVIDYGHQDGRVESLDRLGPSSGSSALAAIGEDGAALQHSIKMSSPVAGGDGEAFGTAFYGIKVVRVDVIKDKDTEQVKETRKTPMTVSRLTLSAYDKEEGNGWATRTVFNPVTKVLASTSEHPSDSITIDLDAPSDGRIYMAVPSADHKLRATFCARDTAGYVFTVNKVIPAVAGTYYPITLEMKFADYVNMGDTVEWGTHNVGGETPADYGDYFAWGETKPKVYYYWLPESYRQYYGDEYMYKWGCAEEGITKYNDNDHKYVLDDADDAATANWGAPWRMPYADEIWRLSDGRRYTHTLTTMKDSYGEDILGEKVTSLANGNSVFFPFGGFKYGGNTYAYGQGAYYWGKELYRSGGTGPDGKVPDGTHADTYLGSDYGNMLGDRNNPNSLQGFGVGGGSMRFSGYLVRPVRASKNVTHVKQ